MPSRLTRIPIALKLSLLVSLCVGLWAIANAAQTASPAGMVHPQVRLFTPLPGEDVTSPLMVRGEARGTWYFEADFPIRLFDASGRELAVAIATAQEPWMTEDFVPFEAELVFEAPAEACLVMVLEKDNPSDLRELDDEVRVGLRCPLEK